MKETCTVVNKSSGRVGYKTATGGRVVFYPRESKPNVSVESLKELIQQPGGLELFYNYLYVGDKEIVKYLTNADIAPEYWITEAELPNWMNTCSLASFQDALDFAPEGTKDLIKKYAVEMPLNDYSKRQAIKEQLGFDVTAMIDNSGDEIETPASKPASRRVAVTEDTSAIEAPAAPKRRVIVQDN